jgi:hypothetical protein
MLDELRVLRSRHPDVAAASSAKIGSLSFCAGSLVIAAQAGGRRLSRLRADRL